MSWIKISRTNLDLAFGMTQRDDSAVRLPETRRIEGQDASASRQPERSLLDAQGTAKLQCCNYFKNPAGGIKESIVASVIYEYMIFNRSWR
jgi:hypothetical protein